MAKILCIEDDPDLQKIVGEALVEKGHQVHYAFSGQEGLGKMASVDPDMVLLDLMLPGISGVEVIESMQADPRTRFIPVIVVTGYNDPASMLSRSLKALGAVAFVKKPINGGELCALIEVAMRSHPKKRPAQAEIRKGVLRADTRFRTLWVGEKLKATLPPKIFALLQILMEAEGPVRREPLLRKVWGPDAEEHVLAKAIQRLRAELGPEGRRVQTVEDGYELIG